MTVAKHCQALPFLPALGLHPHTVLAEVNLPAIHLSRKIMQTTFISSFPHFPQFSSDFTPQPMVVVL
jgi:hypothetical protein